MNIKQLGLVAAFCLLLSLICSGSVVGFAVAEPLKRVAGVKVGDMVKYGNFQGLFDSTLPGAVPPQNLIDLNNTLSVAITFLNVSGSSISYETRTDYRNGTASQVSVSEVDVASGQGLGNFTFVAAELGAGDKVYLADKFSNMRLNSTSLRGYFGLMRDTNLLNVTQIFIESARASSAFWTELYWDKATGLLMEYYWSSSVFDEDGFWTGGLIKYNIVDNNVWLGVSDSVLPVARAGSDQTVDVGVAVVFDAGGSGDNVGIARFLWDFGDGDSAVGLQVSHAYAKVGVFNVTLTVEDGSGNKGFDYVTMTVRESATSFLTSGLVLLIAGVVVFGGGLSIRWLLLRRRRLHSRKRK